MASPERPYRPSGDPRRFGTLLLLGASVLLYRTVALLHGGRGILQSWVLALTLAEMAIDLATIAGAARWCVTRSGSDASLPLRTGAAATVLHALRVSIFVLGRTGPWVDFDVRPERRATHRDRWTWAQVVFAGTMSVFGLVALAAIWSHERRWNAIRPKPAEPPPARGARLRR